MKRSLLMMGVLGALTMWAGPVTDISSGNITRNYVWSDYYQAAVYDSLTLNGSNGGVAFSINIGPYLDDSSVPLSGGSAFTDQITAANMVFYLPSAVLGTLTLDIEATLNGFSPPQGCYLLTPPCPPPGPTSFTGDFTATGSFISSGPGGVDIPLYGVGTTTLSYTTVYDPTVPAIDYVLESISYDFVAVPEPSAIFTAGLGLGLLALTRRRRRRRSPSS